MKSVTQVSTIAVFTLLGGMVVVLLAVVWLADVILPGDST